MVAAAALLVPLNIFFARWLDRHWDGWFAGNGNRVETKLRKMRGSKLMRHPVAWIEGGWTCVFALAAGVTNAITVVSLARVIGGKPLGDRRTALAGIGYGLFCSGIWVLAGFLLGDVIRAA